jgi:hypothetical protein
MKYTTLETGKKLRDLGFEPTDKSWLWTLDEVLDRLPMSINLYQLCLTKDTDRNVYICMYFDNLNVENETLFRSEHEIATEAAAQLLIKLVESGDIKKEN